MPRNLAKPQLGINIKLDIEDINSSISIFLILISQQIHTVLSKFSALISILNLCWYGTKQISAISISIFKNIQSFTYYILYIKKTANCLGLSCYSPFIQAKNNSRYWYNSVHHSNHGLVQYWPTVSKTTKKSDCMYVHMYLFYIVLRILFYTGDNCLFTEWFDLDTPCNSDKDVESHCEHKLTLDSSLTGPQRLESRLNPVPTIQIWAPTRFF